MIPRAIHSKFLHWHPELLAIIIAVFSVTMLSTQLVYAQQSTSKTDSINIFKPMSRYRSIAKDQLLITVTHDQMMNTPDGLTQNPISAGYEASYLYQIVGQHSLVSLAIGLGLSGQNFKTNSLIVQDSSGVSFFRSINDSIPYTQNKLHLDYVDIPLELRLRTVPDMKGRSFKLNIGIKAGYQVQNYSKYVGEDYRSTSTGESVKFKEYWIQNMSVVRYGPYIRIGYSQFAINAYYSLSNLFQKDLGPEISIFSFGLTLIPI